jgi:hypothetical protein
MSTKIIKYHKRYIVRKHNKALSDIYKILTELITNSDESYQRLLSKNIEVNHAKKISIFINRNNKLVQIVDCAEGMSEVEMDNNVSQYGSEKSGQVKGHAGRGLYGQGLIDVLFLNDSNRSRLYSIKNNKACVGEFWYNDSDQAYDIKPIDSNQLALLRKKFDIPKNGTIIEFNLSDKINLPKYQNLYQRLSSAYMLRFINSNSDREIYLTEIEKNKKPITKKIEYTFIEKKYPKDSTLLLNDKKFFKYDKFPSPIEIDIKIFKAEFDLKQKIGDDANGLLIYDNDNDNSVYDLDLFGFENSPGANNIFGYIKLKNIRNLIESKLKEKDPEEILTDTRDGFDKSHKFYKQFSLQIKDLLTPIFQNLHHVNSDESTESEETKKKHQEVFNKLNEFYSNLVDDKNSGTFDDGKKELIHGIKFVRDNIKITAGRTYSLKLKVNTNDFSKKAKIFLDCNEKNINFSPRTITLSQEYADDSGMIYKTIAIKSQIPNLVGTLFARCEEEIANCVIQTLQTELYYPEDGIGFDPSSFYAIVNKKSKLHLFIDLKKVKDGKIIQVESDNHSIELLNEALTVPEEKIANTQNTSIVIDFVGTETEEQGIITAKVDGYETSAEIFVNEKNETINHGNNKGIFRGWKFDIMPEQLQADLAKYGEDEGYIKINKVNPINIQYFGSSPIRSDVDKSIITQLYLSELILNVALNHSVSEAYSKGNLGQQSDDPYTEISRHINLKKIEIGSQIYGLFVNKNLYNNYQNFLTIENDNKDANVLISRINSLDGRLKEMIEMRFGLNDNRKHTLDEIAIKYQLTRERIRQIINSALPKLYKDDEIITYDEVLKEENTAHDDEANVDFIDRFEKSLGSVTESIIEKVAKFYGIKVSDIKGISRKKEYVFPRQIAMYFIREKLKYSFPVIGGLFGRDHTTVMHSCNQVQKIQIKNKDITEEIKRLESNLSI